MSEFKSKLVSVLFERGFIYQCTALRELDEYAFGKEQKGEKVSAYIGFDLTAESLHVGSLIQLMVLRWLDKLNHNPVALLGDGTTKIGDPTGKSSARPMLSEDDISKNQAGISGVISSVVGNVNFVNNSQHYDFNFIDFMRQYGSHFTANRLLAMDAIKSRVNSTDGISVMELMYPMLQAIDFHNLTKAGISLQVGGSDQWGNITAGTDLVRRMGGEKAFGLTTPLFTNSKGEKMGKTVGGAVWLDSSLTSVHDFFQFWMNVEDDQVETCLKLFTDLGLHDIAQIMGPNGGGIIEAKRELATQVTSIVHGAGVGQREAERSLLMFRDKSFTGAPDASVVAAEGRTLASVMVEVGLVKSNKEADRMALNRGVRVDGEVVDDVRCPVTSSKFTLAVGKKAFTIHYHQ